MSDDALCQVTVVENGAALADRVRCAHTHWTRLRGLLGTRPLESDGGLWLRPCRQVHMIGMRYPIDVVFLDDQLQVVRTVADLQPGTVSPKVAAATSVLEVQAGRLAALGIVQGQRLAISPDRQRSSATERVTAALLNVLLASLYGVFASVHFSAGWRSGEWSSIAPMFIQESVLMAVFLTRRPTREVTSEPIAWVMGVLGTLVPLLFRPTEVSALHVLGATLQSVGLLLVLLAITSLGRSFGVVPAHRGIKTAGMYRFVRHPLYTAYVLSHVGYVMSYPSLRNLLVATITALALSLRARFEEQLLTRDPHYAAYARRVAWRFLPHIY